ncbi:DMT family transporter [Aestuariivirga sp.]|uniref:DMT family transporter n=1 Tax=Aestuariivirga sp. TaxID=2650926 RepID=UPI0025BCBC47|nr:DMT family transporter [Aestuariivirga sp.]MCA3555406.1 DMT family transporter [Aestuariivirga sp.]
MASAYPAPQVSPAAEFRFGVLLVAGSAVTWSFGGTIARFIQVADPWTVVFWRALFAASFLLLFMLWRDGPRATGAMFRTMGLPALGVAICFGVASSCFVVALQYTTVANILLTQAAAPLFAGLLAWMVFGERINAATWAAIAAVIGGVAIMVSASFSGEVSPIGDGLALVITIMFSAAIVITRHHPDVRMTPAVCLGAAMACVAAFFLSGPLPVSPPDLGWLFLFGAVNLGAGLAMFVTGARLIPAALAALVGTLEPVLGPLWVWLFHGEAPGARTIFGGAIVFAALFVHILNDWQRQRKQKRAGSNA